MSLPYAMAKEMGIEPKSSDPKVTGILADGSEVEATRIKLASVRVGKFTVEDVDCDVFERQAVNAAPLLGMSFLGNFKIEIDKQKSELRMVKVDSGDTPPRRRKSSPAQVETRRKAKRRKTWIGTGERRVVRTNGRGRRGLPRTSTKFGADYGRWY